MFIEAAGSMIAIAGGGCVEFGFTDGFVVDGCLEERLLRK